MRHDDSKLLPYGKWLQMALVFPPKSRVSYSIRSLRELHWILQPSANSFPSVDLEHLARWAEESLESPELASFVRKTAREEIGYKQKCLKIHAWISRSLEELEEEENG